MSIIDKALKKTQQDLLNRQVQSTTTEKQATESISNILQKNEKNVKKYKPKNNHYIFLILTTLLLCLLVWQTMKPHQKQKNTVSAVGMQQAQSAILTVGDPTKGLSLGGIMATEGHRIALINSQTYQVGDKLHGATITTIEDDQVVLSKGKQSFKLRLSAA